MLQGSTNRPWYFSSVRGPRHSFLGLPMAAAPSRLTPELLPFRCRFSSLLCSARWCLPSYLSRPTRPRARAAGSTRTYEPRPYLLWWFGAGPAVPPCLAKSRDEGIKWRFPFGGGVHLHSCRLSFLRLNKKTNTGQDVAAVSFLFDLHQIIGRKLSLAFPNLVKLKTDRVFDGCGF